MPPNLIIFSNFLIDNEERFLRMKDSYRSIKSVSINKWVVNIRGRYANDAGDFLRQELGDKLILHKLSSKEGWFSDSRIMLADITGDFVLFWLEDHICLCSGDKIDKVVDDMRAMNVDSLMYSWWPHTITRYRGIHFEIGKHIDVFLHDIKAHIINRGARSGVSPYIISAAGIFAKALFERIVISNDPVVKRWPKDTPFDFEKGPQDAHWLPIRVGLPKEELFACIDDDLGCEGADLISRGLYPKRANRQSYANNYNKGLRRYISKNVLLKISKMKRSAQRNLGDLLFLMDLRILCLLWRLIFDNNGAVGSYKWIQKLHRSGLDGSEAVYLPGFSFPIIEFLVTCVLGKLSVCEFGNCDGLLWWAERTADVTGCLCDKLQYKKISDCIPNSIKIGLIEHDSNFWHGGQKGLSKAFDIIAISGPDSLRFLTCAADYLKGDGVILLCDSARPALVSAISSILSSGMKRIDFVGMEHLSSNLTTTTLFYRSENCLEI